MGKDKEICQECFGAEQYDFFEAYSCMINGENIPLCSYKCQDNYLRKLKESECIY